MNTIGTKDIVMVIGAEGGFILRVCTATVCTNVWLCRERLLRDRTEVKNLINNSYTLN